MNNTKRYANKNGLKFLKADKGNKPKKEIKDYQFYIRTNKQVAEYKIVAEFIINYIKRTFEMGNDIAETLRALSIQNTNEWMPKLKGSNAEDEEVKLLENAQNQIKYKTLLDQAVERKNKYNENMHKAYEFLWEKCSRAMQNKIAGRRDFEEKILNDPINILKAIKEHSLNYQESRYEMSVILDLLRTFLNTRQKESEPLQEYTRRFKTAKDIMESHKGGPLILTKYIQLSQEYQTDKKRYQNNVSNGIFESIEPNAFKAKYLRKAAKKFYVYIYLEMQTKPNTTQF